jgi:hypothetical protein
MPLAFNWQSAPFGLQALVGYLFPIQLAYTAGVIVTVVVAGTGGYFLGRVLHLGVLGCAMAGTVMELSGPFVGWLGWPHAQVFSWAGWLFGAAILVVNASRPIRAIAGFALVLALAGYGGQPEILVVLLFGLAVFLLVLLLQHALREGARSVLRPILNLAIASTAGVALAAPLFLPGLQIFAGSVHSKTSGQPALPAQNLIQVIVQGFDGLPIAGSQMFGVDGPFYIPAYVGLIALVLAVVAVALRRRSPEVVAFAALLVVSTGVVFVPAVNSIMNGLPLFGSVVWTRALLTLTFGCAVLAGVGLDSLVRASNRRVWKWTGVGFLVAGALLVGIYVVSVNNLPAPEKRIRGMSFVWPAVQVLVGLVLVIGFLWWKRRRHDATSRRAMGDLRSWVGLGFLACETVFLLFAGAPLWSSSPTFFAATPAVTAFQHDVKSALVGFGPNPTLNCSALGLYPDVNDAYSVNELAVYDPMVPKGYFTSFQHLTGRPAGFLVSNTYCPALTSVAQARLYGVTYILESMGVPAPEGTRYVGKVGDEDLYHVPGSYRATLTPMPPGRGIPAVDAEGAPVGISDSNPSDWTIKTDSLQPQMLRLRLTNVPGWNASIDGKPLTLKSYSTVMLQARIPPGKHVVEVTYWPAAFTAGIALAICSAAGLLIALIVDNVQRRRPPASSLP